MGLCLNYELRLPPDRLRADMIETLESLQRFATALPVHRVAPICLFDRERTVPEFFNGSERFENFIHEWASILAKPSNESSPTSGMNWNADSAAGFVIAVGKGCEAAPIGFLHGRSDDGTREEWFWYASVKTQYASVVSDEHLVTCHTALVSLLDHAIEIGVDVVVRDETGYWPSRNAATLIDEVHKMNRIVAKLAGVMCDSLMLHHVGGAIVHHPDFEHLEMER